MLPARDAPAPTRSAAAATRQTSAPAPPTYFHEPLEVTVDLSVLTRMPEEPTAPEDPIGALTDEAWPKDPTTAPEDPSSARQRQRILRQTAIAEQWKRIAIRKWERRRQIATKCARMHGGVTMMCVFQLF